MIYPRGHNSIIAGDVDRKNVVREDDIAIDTGEYRAQRDALGKCLREILREREAS